MNKKQLWDSILQQAISGKLAPQLDSEPAVEQIGPALDPDDVPFELPEEWKWVQLENLCTYMQRGKSPKYSDIKRYPVVAQKCNQWDGLHLELALFFDPSTLSSYKAERFLQQDDVLLNSTGTGTLGRVGSYDKEANPYELAVADSHVTVIRAKFSCLMPYYLKFVLRSDIFQRKLIAAGTGTTKQQELALSKVKQLWIPLPPLEEQRRIVAKLDELKPLVDQFGEAHDKLSELEADFPRKLKASILQAAMQGKLVPQLDTEPAVEQIGPKAAPEEVPFKLPEKWKWVQLEHLNLASFSGGTPTKNNPDYWNGSIPWASIKDLSVDSEELSATQDHITEKGVANSSTKLVEANNIIVGMRMGLDKIAINKIAVAINQDLRALYLDYKLIDPKFFIKFYKTLRFEGTGTTVKGIKKNELMALFVPLPPLEEQRRIVERIEQLFAEVDKMSACKAP